MVATRESVRFSSSESNPSDRTQASTSEAQPSPAGVYGQWTPNGFVFASPQEQKNWHRDAYRQAVSHENWHKGQIVDPDTAHLIDANVAGPTPPTFRGPDGQLRYFGTQTAEGPDVAAIRARHFRTASRSDFERTVIPGEAEAAAHMASQTAIAPANDNRQSGPVSPTAVNEAKPAVSSLKLPVTPSNITKGLEPATERITASHMTKNSLSTLDPKGRLILADSYEIPEGVSPQEFFASPASAEPVTATEGSKAPEKPAANYAHPSAPSSGSILTSNNQSPELVRSNLIKDSVESATITKKDLEGWTKRQEANPNNKDPVVLAERVREAAEWLQRFAMNDYNGKKFAIDGVDATAVEMDAIRKYLDGYLLSKYSDANKLAVEKEWAKQGHIIQNGPIGLEATLGLFQNANTVSISIGGQDVQAKIPNPWGRLGDLDTQALNRMVNAEAQKKIQACEGFSRPETLGGPHDSEDKMPEYWFQDYSERNVQQGGRYMDVSIRFHLNDHDTCELHINTVDVLKSGLISKKEWGKIGDALTHAKGNAERDDIIEGYNDLIRGRKVAKSVAFLAIPKQAKGMSPDELRKAVQDFLDMISCANITAACESNDMINLDRQTAPDKFQIRQ